MLVLPKTVNGCIYFFTARCLSAAKYSTAVLKHVRLIGLKYMAKTLPEMPSAATDGPQQLLYLMVKVLFWNQFSVSSVSSFQVVPVYILTLAFLSRSCKQGTKSLHFSS